MRKKVIERERSMEPRASLKAPSKLIACLRIQDCTISQNRRLAATPRERKVQVIENTISAFFFKHATSQLQPRTLEVECFLPLGVEVVVSATVVVAVVVVNVVVVCVVMGGENTNGK